MIAADCRPRTSPPSRSAASIATQQPLDERRALGQPGLVGGGHGRPAGVALQQVALHREAVAHQVAGGRDRLRAGVRGRPALRVDHAELPDLRVLIAGQQGGHRLLGVHARAQQLQADRPECDVDRCLGGDRPDARPPATAPPARRPGNATARRSRSGRSPGRAPRSSRSSAEGSASSALHLTMTVAVHWSFTASTRSGDRAPARSRGGASARRWA